MRTTLPLLLLLALAPPLPAAGAGSGSEGGVGMNLGYVDVGLWDLWYFDKVDGASWATFHLTWEGSLLGADYDLRLYPPGSLDDGALDEPALAWSEARAFSPRSEGFSLSLPEGKYVLAVVPYQAQGERYVVTADPGWLTDIDPPAAGVQLLCPVARCPLG